MEKESWTGPHGALRLAVLQEPNRHVGSLALRIDFLSELSTPGGWKNLQTISRH